MLNKTCPVCENRLSIGLQPWHFFCSNCLYECSNLNPKINEQFGSYLIDEDSRKLGLKDIRIFNFKKLLLKINSLVSHQKKMLEIGCGHGWFLNEAKDHFDVYGLEPDQSIFDSILPLEMPIRLGYFPQILDVHEKFDIIVFNDVIEHIPDISSILESCNQHLNQNGLLVLNLPSTNGIFYSISKILCRFGCYGMFERLWQKDFPSPHLHYLNKINLVKLLVKKGFDVRSKGSLSTLVYAGIFSRIFHTNELSFFTASVIYLCAIFFLPALKILPSDIIYVISEKK